MSLTLTIERGGGEVSGSGTNIELDGTIAGGAIESVEMYGNTEQQTYTGKNLLNLATFVAGRVDNGVVGYASDTSSFSHTESSITFTTTANYRGVVSDFIEVSPSTQYVLNRPENATNYMDFYTASKTWISRATSNPFTTPANCGFVRVSYQGTIAGTFTENNPQFEQGSASTEFEPYVGGTASPNPDYPQVVQTVTGEQTITISDGNSQVQSYTVDLGSIELCKIGDYQDYVYKSNGDWYVHKEFEKINLGSLTWNTEASGTNYRLVCQTQYTDLQKPASNNSLPVAICSHYGIATAGDTYSGVQGLSMSQSNRFYIYDNNYNGSSSATAYNTWVQTNNPITYWKLATATDTQITDSALIAQLDALNEATTYDGTTVITVSSENLAGPLEVTVKTSIEKTYTEVEIGSPFNIADVEGKSSNTTLDGNVYVDWAYTKKQYSFDLFNLTPQDYADIRAFYDYQFSNSAFPTISVPELNIERLPVYMEISSRNIVNQCLLTDKITLNFRETVQP